MSKELRSKISYWGFLILGFLGLSIMINMLNQGKLSFVLGELIVAIFFVGLIIRPRFILEVAQWLMKRFNNGKCKHDA